MKKLIPLILLAVAAVFALTSCDAILEAMFPEDTVGTSSGSNSIVFNVTGYDWYYWTQSVYGYGYWDYDGIHSTAYAQAPIHVEVYDSQGTKVAEDFDYFNEQYFGAGVRIVPQIQFDALPDGNYSFVVWYDYDNDGEYTSESSYDLDGYYYRSYDDDYTSNIYVSDNDIQQVDVSLFEYNYWY